MEWVGGWTPPQEKSKASFFLAPLQAPRPTHMCPTHVCEMWEGRMGTTKQRTKSSACIHGRPRRDGSTRCDDWRPERVCFPLRESPNGCTWEPPHPCSVSLARAEQSTIFCLEEGEPILGGHGIFPYGKGEDARTRKDT